MTRGFLTGISATGNRPFAPQLGGVTAASRRRARCVLAWVLAAFCWAGGAGWAFGQADTPGAQAGAPALGAASSEAPVTSIGVDISPTLTRSRARQSR